MGNIGQPPKSAWSKIKERVRPFAQAASRTVLKPASPRLPPIGYESAKSWAESHRGLGGVTYSPIYPPRSILEANSITLDTHVPKVFREHRQWVRPEAFVCTLPQGRVWGRRGAVISNDNYLLGDISREFGAYRGAYNDRHSIFKQILLAPLTIAHGKIGVVACPGSQTYFHWLFDVLPRIHLLKQGGYLDELAGLVIDYEGLPFQEESIAALGIDPKKLIIPNGHWDFHLECDLLVAPSLSSDLCTIADWAVPFLRETFLGKVNGFERKRDRRLFISRQRAPSRCERNYDEVLQFLSQLGFEEYFAEDHSIEETARDFAMAGWVIGLHGGGLANLAFASRDTSVIELLPPKHVDPLFWILSNFTGCRHGYLFAEGELPDDSIDLVSMKVDDNVTISVEKLKRLMTMVERGK